MRLSRFWQGLVIWDGKLKEFWPSSAQRTLRWFGFGVLIPHFLIGCTNMDSQKDRLKVNSPDFSPDNKTLLLAYCPPRSDCTLALYELGSGRLSVFRPPQGEEWGMGKFSADVVA